MQGRLAGTETHRPLSSLGRHRLRPGAARACRVRSGQTALKPGHLIREILYPLTDTAVLLALIAFLFLEILAEAAGLLGIWLAIVIVPAYFRYLLYLLDLRAIGRDAPTPGIELFNWVENFWSLFPLVILCLAIWGSWFLAARLSPVFAAIFAALLLLIYPASLAVLATTRSPIESLNPLALLRVITSCGRDYLLIPLVMTAMCLMVWTLAFLQLPSVVTKLLAMYASFLMFTLTGGVIFAAAPTFDTETPPTRAPDPDRLDAELIRDRSRVLNHAYGFVSRGNRQGGLEHLCRWIENETDYGAAFRWFFERMLHWESKDAALALAQSYLGSLLAEHRDVEALKLINRCRLENASFRLLAEHRGAALAAAERLGNREICDYLGDR